ncbi:polyketide cyclase [Mycobacterium sp. 236(2023)]|uniref:polyketide cyclase n=1 Tax=Mycobacterium sp. 236(2023) TaxID=3038163 RepID=UPI0024150798|nr:polyketide cyclase [Mycobacterium sp. 236(2023)]MDG4665209.1 polyketide cyclase [Mycobacterium sp. 236(2023)]
MTEEFVAAKAVIGASAETVFDLLADPSTHGAIDGTGWVQQPVDRDRLTDIGQIFRMGMYHDGHPNKHYEMSNRIEVLDRPRAIAWMPGAQPRHIPGRDASEGDTVEYGGWIWRYDLVPAGTDRTHVTLTYDWSGVQDPDIEFPPFDPVHLDNSLQHLAELAESA